MTSEANDAEDSVEAFQRMRDDSSASYPVTNDAGRGTQISLTIEECKSIG